MLEKIREVVNDFVEYVKLMFTPMILCHSCGWGHAVEEINCPYCGVDNLRQEFI